MKVFDAHCDVLSKILVDPLIRFENDAKLDVTLERLKKGHVSIQCFAMFVPDRFLGTSGFHQVLKMAELFATRIKSIPEVAHIKYSEDLQRYVSQNADNNMNKIGAMLSLEGADSLSGNLSLLRILFDLGVRCIGLTWNHANWIADGAMEPRQGGLTLQGIAFVKECNKLGILMDVSHLSEPAFWQVTELSATPVFASHSNVREICEHPRNLYKKQIERLIEIDGVIGLTFVPWFTKAQGDVTVDDLLKHVEAVCELGGERNLAFGSDFDGIEKWITGLSHPGDFVNLGNALLKHYSEDFVNGFLFENWYRYFERHLPKRVD